MPVRIGRSTLRGPPGGSPQLITLTALLVMALSTACGGVPIFSPPPEYTFVEDFDGPAGTGPDESKWTFDVGGGGWGNGELQTYTRSRANSFLDGRGHLVIRATRTTLPRPGNAEEIVYHSARLKTVDRFAQRYGHWEARMKIESRPGLWPAWWMLGDNYPVVGWPRSGEVDMVEDYGFSAVESSVHTSRDVPSITSYSGGTANDSTFHTFRMDWSPEGVAFARDDVPYAGVSWAPEDPNVPIDPPQPMFMLLNLAVGGTIGAPPPEVAFPVDLVVDYVKVW
ncbi:glycoside hydrolase family 16 protein [Actinomycetospora callitridis]|uniref:glycoside hydrolase family 16 protein n=1 Tax=Actinomycetospora callitridis TaxID=913944 RepID=UPI0030825D45